MAVVAIGKRGDKAVLAERFHAGQTRQHTPPDR